MDVSNTGTSVYHRFRCLYHRVTCHNPDSTLIHVHGPSRNAFVRSWPLIDTRLRALPPDGPPLRLSLDTHDQHSTNICATENVAIYEAVLSPEEHKPRHRIVRGICIAVPADTRSQHENEHAAFDLAFAHSLLRQAHIIAPCRSPCSTPVGDATCENEGDDAPGLVEFEALLRNHAGKNDAWKSKGRRQFIRKSRHFGRSSSPVQFVLPAFPCKSSNMDKVASREPDAGEEMALRRLHEFVGEIKKTYEFGAKVCIVSDGHVFSDCIGIDDVEVDAYTQSLRNLNDLVAADLPTKGDVYFLSLVDLFKLSAPAQSTAFSSLNLAAPTHFLPTKLTRLAELSRKVLMVGCEPDRAAVRMRIADNHSPLLALYRGFSRFMLEDLERHPAVEGAMSRSALRRLSPKVAFEMIMRNQAYSNLVEMLFPDHIRLSIHAHDNSGAKFGIRLYDAATTSTIASFDRSSAPTLSSNAPSCVDHLHIPTPWHNCVMRVIEPKPDHHHHHHHNHASSSRGSQPRHTSYLVKSRVVRQALRDGTLSGGWDPRARCFMVRRAPHTPTDGAVAKAETDAGVSAALAASSGARWQIGCSAQTLAAAG